MASIGVLAVQGAFEAHAEVLRALGHGVTYVRSARELYEDLDGLVLPGGESSVQLEMIARLGMEAPLRAFVTSGAPVLATCAGLILVAREVESPKQQSLGALDVVVARNAWGRQVDSFEAESDVDSQGKTRPLVFIRAPRILSAGPKVQVLARYRDEAVLIRQSNVWGATFHPELTGDGSLHSEVFPVAAGPRSEPRRHRSSFVSTEGLVRRTEQAEGDRAVVRRSRWTASGASFPETEDRGKGWEPTRRSP